MPASNPGSLTPINGSLDTSITNAGLMGITAKQLAIATNQSLDKVEEELTRLSSTKQVSRVGRGLWVTRDFAESPNMESAFRGPAWYSAQFSRQFGLKIGSYSGEIQFNPNEKIRVHRWWPYVQGFSAAFVERTCHEYGFGRGATVLDPFCGSGTVPVVARTIGARGIGTELMPIAAFVARAKQNWTVGPEAFFRSSRSVLKAVATAKPSQVPFLKETRRQFRPEILDTLLRLKTAIWRTQDERVATALRLCFASILIDCSNLKRAPCLGYTKKLGLTADTPLHLFERATTQMYGDLKTLQLDRSSWGPEAKIVEADSRLAKLPARSVDIAITSPPYVNGMDYVMNYKIELAWLDFAKSYEDLQRLKSTMVACDNVSHSVIDQHKPGSAVGEDRWLAYILKTVTQNIELKTVYRRDDMPGIVTKYFDDLCPVIANVLLALKPGGRFVVVNGDSMIAGTYVPGDLIFARLAAVLGFEVESLDVARVRRSGQRRDFLLRETILTLRKPGGRASRSANWSHAVTLDDFVPR
jgi:DNA modification methylase